MHVILIHGMGRTPLAMGLLAYRLYQRGMQPSLFGYSPTFERWHGCLERYRRFIDERTKNRPYIVVGHSLGNVITRGVWPSLAHKPEAFFLLAPPSRACAAARKLAPLSLYRVLFGEMGQLLADSEFMDSLPVPDAFMKIYAGDAGPVGRFSPFATEANDGILAVDETRIPGVVLQKIPASHTFIMNRPEVADDIARQVAVLLFEQRGDPAS
jgi:pimeloyl-ACP methyl ester carboxylesterase